MLNGQNQSFLRNYFIRSGYYNLQVKKKKVELQLPKFVIFSRFLEYYSERCKSQPTEVKIGPFYNTFLAEGLQEFLFLPLFK